MKKVYFIIIPILLIGYLIVLTLIPRTNSQNLKSGNEISGNQNQISIEPEMSSDHINQAQDCKSCHACENPTRKDPCLINCPRNNTISDNHSPEEGPEEVVINEMSENYSGVVFSHRIHSMMSDMSIGCEGCHHYNTSGPILNCRKCHENIRDFENVSVPDLKAAYHRQCMNCHKQWSHENGCNNQCHLLKGSETKLQLQNAAGKKHPNLPEPTKMVWETNYENGKIVTFFHNEHNHLFKISCRTCHSQDNCIKCHESKSAPIDYNKPVKIQKSLEEHHKPCFSCHQDNNCQKCHKEKEMAPFSHSRTTGWVLKSFHSNLACAKCHGNQIPFRRPDKNCVSCHKNFTKGNFDHKVTGIILSDVHKEAECNNCHLNGDFSKNPDCKMCHDDKSFPSQIPGTRK